MKIGLVDVDSRHFPNLALMRLSAWHKAQGDAVEWWNGFTHYDRVYLSKVFTFTPDHDTVIDADEIVTGGTGYKDYGTLPPEVEKTFPDYSIYPQYHQAIGFLTRGCCRACEWCVVPRKEGPIRPAATWEQVKRPDSRELVLMDNNVLACGHGLEQIARMGREEVWVDFNQGLDARFITPNIAALLAKLKWIRFVRLSCDTSAMVPVIEQAAAYLKEAGVAPPGCGATCWSRMWRAPTAGCWPWKSWASTCSPSPTGTTTAVSRQRSKKPSPAGSTSSPSTVPAPGRTTANPEGEKTRQFLLVLMNSFQRSGVLLFVVNVKGGESVDRRSQKYQVNTFRRKQRAAPLHSMRRGVFVPSRREFQHKNHDRKG